MTENMKICDRWIERLDNLISLYEYYGQSITTRLTRDEAVELRRLVATLRDMEEYEENEW